MSEISRKQQEIQDLDSALQIQYAKNMKLSEAVVAIAIDERPTVSSSQRIETVTLNQEPTAALVVDHDEVFRAAETTEIEIEDENNSRSESYTLW